MYNFYIDVYIYDITIFTITSLYLVVRSLAVNDLFICHERHVDVLVFRLFLLIYQQILSV